MQVPDATAIVPHEGSSLTLAAANPPPPPAAKKESTNILFKKFRTDTATKTTKQRPQHARTESAVALSRAITSGNDARQATKIFEKLVKNPSDDGAASFDKLTQELENLSLSPKKVHPSVKSKAAVPPLSRDDFKDSLKVAQFVRSQGDLPETTSPYNQEKIDTFLALNSDSLELYNSGTAHIAKLTAHDRKWLSELLPALITSERHAIDLMKERAYKLFEEMPENRGLDEARIAFQAFQELERSKVYLSAKSRREIAEIKLQLIHHVISRTTLAGIIEQILDGNRVMRKALSYDTRLAGIEPKTLFKGLEELMKSSCDTLEKQHQEGPASAAASVAPPAQLPTKKNIDNLMQFVSSWINGNVDSTYCSEEVQHLIASLSGTLMTYNLASDQTASPSKTMKELAADLEKLPITHQNPVHHEPVVHKITYIHTSDTIKLLTISDICKGGAATVKKVAKTIVHYQRRKFIRLSGHHLINKWGKPHTRLIEFEQNSSHLKNFVEEKIKDIIRHLSNKNYDLMGAVGFFNKVAEQSLQLGDVESCYAILQALYQNARLFEMYEQRKTSPDPNSSSDSAEPSNTMWEMVVLRWGKDIQAVAETLQKAQTTLIGKEKLKVPAISFLRSKIDSIYTLPKVVIVNDKEQCNLEALDSLQRELARIMHFKLSDKKAAATTSEKKAAASTDSSARKKEKQKVHKDKKPIEKKPEKKGNDSIPEK